MNKTEFIEELKKRTGLDDEKCSKINEALEGNFIIGKENKEKILDEICSKIGADRDVADKIYNSAMDIMGGEIINKIKNPFKSQD